jgi:1,2-diacylglycerol 3-alpha-glucosyltransferase
MRRTKVFLVCPGLGHVARGYETFTRECFDALSSDDQLDLHLYKGAGLTVDQERAIWCLRRNGRAARLLGTAIGRDGYDVEQMAFVLALIAQIVRLRPEVVYFSDGVVGNLLWRWRRLSHWRFKLLLSNGGPLGPPAFPRFDHVHQVSEVYHQESMKAGRTAETQTLIPYGFRINPRFHTLSLDERADLRRRLRLPTDRPVVLSVGALNRSHKRMDYVIREVASLPARRPYLLVLGNMEQESPSIMRLGNELLGSDGFRAATVPQAEIAKYYQSADIFVLASLNEGFGRAYVEALAHGLPCLVHDYPGARSILGSRGLFGDFTARGALSHLISGLRLAEETEPVKKARHDSAYTRYSWERLQDRYVDMIKRCAAEPNYRLEYTGRLAPETEPRISKAAGLNPMISVVIPTYHRPDLLARCLDRLAPGAQTLPADQYEVIVTDDGPTTAEASLAQKYSWVTWAPGPRRGPAANRNAGARLARGTWLAFTDDDCVPDQNWLTGFTTAVHADCRVYEGKTTCLAGIHSPLEHAPENITGGKLWSCNIFVQRSAFDDVGGFDEAFLYPHMEDIELRERLVEAGYPFEFVPGAAVDHPPRTIASGRKLARYHESWVYYWYKRGHRELASPGMLYRITATRLAIIKSHGLNRNTLRAIGSLTSELGATLIRVPLWEWKYRWRFRTLSSR